MWTGPPRAPLYKRSVQPPHIAGDFYPPATEGGGGISSRAGWPLILAPSRAARRQAGRRALWRPLAGPRDNAGSAWCQAAQRMARA